MTSRRLLGVVTLTVPAIEPVKHLDLVILVCSVGPQQKKKQSGGCFVAVGYPQCCIEVAVIRRCEDHLNDAIRAELQSGWTFVGLDKSGGTGRAIPFTVLASYSEAHRGRHYSSPSGSARSE